MVRKKKREEKKSESEDFVVERSWGNWWMVIGWRG
jgi:hypothetical protein